MTPELTASALALLITLGYLLTCVIWPFGNCRACKGTGKNRAPFGRAFRICRRCKGTGRRLRVGRVALNWWRRVHSKGSR